MEKNSTSVATRIFCMLLLVAAAFIFHIWSRTAVVTQGFKVSQLRKELNRIEADQIDLKAQRQKLISPKNLDRWLSEFEAKGKTFLPASSEQVIFERAR